MKHLRVWVVALAGVVMALAGWQLIASAQTARDELPPAIVSFTIDARTVSQSAVELGTAQATLSWQAIAMSANYRLTLAYFRANDWVPYPQFPENPPAVASAKLAILPSSDFSPPMFRLAIVNRANQLISQQIVVIPYDLTPAGTPLVSSFTSEVPSISAGTLAGGQATIKVSWRVDNRIPFTNLVFHQIMSDGKEISVELPRANRYIDSLGSGPLRAYPVGNDAGSVRMRLRVIDVRDGKVYNESILNVPVVAGRNVVQPTVQIAPLASATPSN